MAQLIADARENSNPFGDHLTAFMDAGTREERRRAWYLLRLTRPPGGSRLHAAVFLAHEPGPAVPTLEQIELGVRVARCEKPLAFVTPSARSDSG